MAIRLLSSKTALLILALLGLVALILAVILRPTPQHLDVSKQPRNAEYIEAIPQDITPRVRGYGIVKPVVQINNLAEVAGRINYIHPQLISGALLEKDTLVVSIDDIDYRLAFRQAEANVAIAQAQLEELKENQSSLAENLEVVKEKLVFSEKELKRKQELRKKKSISQSQVDAERLKVLQLQQEKISLQQQLATLPSQRNILIAQLDSANAQVTQQQRNIERTQIRMPVTGRISQSNIETEQFVAAGQTLFQVYGIEQVEVEAQFTLEQFVPFLELITSQNSQNIDIRAESINSFINAAQLSAVIRLPVVPGEQWRAEVVSIREQLNPQSRTIGIVVRIDHPYQGVIPGKRPPLLDGMHVEVELKGASVNVIALPIKALQQDQIYLADNDLNLKKINVKPLLMMDSIALFDRELVAAGNKIITSDLVPAIEGMPIKLIHSQKLQDELAKYSVDEEQ
ncbi:HlyD family efflux transporter periplasmic adaptor subunit [Photobacterium sagamiensis]|uniref:efflux RND transporter periplasmic adaptor subunit n=1 Tax=Photobacterium sagamiensis TaxID=2910241 RepID=UPI003D116F14